MRIQKKNIVKSDKFIFSRNPSTFPLASRRLEAAKKPNIKIRKPRGLSTDWEILSDKILLLIKNLIFFIKIFFINFFKLIL